MHGPSYLAFRPIVVFLFVVTLGCPRGVAAAEVLSEDGSLRIQGGGVLTQIDKDYPFGMSALGADDVSIKGRDGWFMQAAFDKGVSDYWVVGIESGYLRYDLDFTVNPLATTGVSGAMGTMNIIPIWGNIKLQYPIERYTSLSRKRFRLVPYATFGAGGMFIDFEEDDYARTNGYLVSTDSSALALKYGAGLDFFFSENMAVSLGGSYLNMEVKTDITKSGSTNTEDVGNNFWLIGGGLKYSF